MDTDKSTAERQHKTVARFLAALNAHDVETAVGYFTTSAEVIALDRDDSGRLISGRTAANGRESISAWLAEFTGAGVRIHPTEHWGDGDALVVVASWSLVGPGLEQVASSSLGRYTFREHLIDRLTVSSPAPPA